MDNHGPCITIEEDVKLTDNDNTQNTALKTPAYCSKDTAYRYYEFYYPKSYPKFDIPVFTLMYPPRYPTTHNSLLFFELHAFIILTSFFYFLCF